jgi:phage recombination protein Bet
MANEIIKKEDRFTEIVPLGASEKDMVKLSVQMVQNLICVKTRSGKTCSENDAIKFIAMCRARRLNPFEGDSFLIGYDGKDGPTFSLITAHQAFLKRAELNVEYDGMKSGVIVERDGVVQDLEGDFYMPGDKVLGGWATVYFKNRKQPMHKRVRLARFQKSYGIWQDDAAGMICKCAEADALRSSFPTMLGGLYMREELNQPAEVKGSAPIFTAPPKAENPPQEAEVVPEPPATPPAGKEEKPATRRKPTLVEEELTLLEKVQAKIKEAGMKDKQFVDFMNEIGSTEGATTLELIAENSPDVLQMLHDQFGDIADRIKGAQ